MYQLLRLRNDFNIFSIGKKSPLVVKYKYSYSIKSVKAYNQRERESERESKSGGRTGRGF